MLRPNQKTFNFWILLFLRFGFGGLLIYAAIHKVVHPHDFAVMVENYGVVGEDLSNWVAVFIPYLEIITGYLLILGVWVDAASVINCILMMVFLGLVTQAYIRKLDISCGCFSVEEGDLIGPFKLLNNFFFAIMSLVLVYLVFNPKKESRDAHHESSGQNSA